MKNIIIKISAIPAQFIAVLMLLITHSHIEAQSLKLGDPAPALNPYEWMTGDPIKSFEKGKVYVVEFGATWCKPCAKAIPELSELSERFKGQVEVVSVFVQERNYGWKEGDQPEYLERVKSYIDKRRDEISYTMAVDNPQQTIENQWINALGQSRGLPQTFIVDKTGVIVAHFSGVNPLTLDKTLLSVLDESYEIQMIEKQRTPYSQYEPLLINGNGGAESSYIFRSILVPYSGDFPFNPSPFLDSYQWVSSNPEQHKYLSLQGKVQEVNASLSDLYYLAYADTLNNEPYSRVQTTKRFPDTVAKPFLKRTYGKYWHKPILEVSDTLPFVSEWGKSGNRWNYSIEVPKERATAAFLQKAMQRDLKTFFGYHVTVEIRNMPCYFLRALPTAEQKLRTATPDGTPYRFELLANWKKDETVEYKNFEIRDLIKYLHNNLFDILHTPFIDETGIIGEIDFTNRKSIYEEVAKGNMEVVQAYLKSFHLYLEKGEKPMKVVVIRDPEELR